MRKILIAALLLQSGYISAQCGKALSFDPNNDSYVMTDLWYPMIYDVENNFTMEFWIKPITTIKAGMIAFNEQYEGWGGQSYAVFPGYYEADSCGVGVSVGTNGVAIIEGGANYLPVSLVHYTAISSTDWTHIAVVYSNRIPSLYINGSLAATGTSSPKAHVFPTAVLGDVSETLNLGPFGGTIDEFRIWSVAFNNVTVASWYDKYTTSSHPFYSNLHTFWKMDEGLGTTTADISENGHTGLLFSSNPMTWVAGWAPVGATAPTVSAGSDENTYFGYAADQCVSKTASVTGGTGPFTYSWSLDRALLPGETMTGVSTASVTVCLMDTAQLCLTVTDPASNCTTTDCANIFAEDVRCGNGNNQKTTICHNGNTICVDNSAVPAHLDHGDYVGTCGITRRGYTNAEVPDPVTVESIKPGFNVYPNPSNGSFTVTVDAGNAAQSLRIFNASGQMIKQMNIGQEHSTKITINEPGVYMVQLVGDKKIISKKVVVIR